jgi:cytochrome bd-type quinol oxidase subunit 2
MIASHLVNLLVFSVIVSALFAALQREGLKNQVRFALMTFAAFVLSTLVLGWLMYPFPN